MVIIQIIAFIVLMVLEAFTDHNIQLSSNGNIETIKKWHKYDAMYKVVIFGLVAILIYTNILNMIWFLLVLLSLRWIVFELVLNILNGQKWYYVGSTAWMDIQLRKLPYYNLTTIVIKAILITVLIILKAYDNV